MEKQYYFPPLNGAVDCSQCEVTDCWCREKYQRNRRDFTHTSGRCPRLPDLRGFVEQEERDAYAAAFPLIHAELGAEDLHLTLTMPGQKQAKRYTRQRVGIGTSRLSTRTAILSSRYWKSQDFGTRSKSSATWKNYTPITVFSAVSWPISTHK